MPFESGSAGPRKIAVIGGGISGMGAAHRLSRGHRVTLFEAEPRLGGHARTVMAGRNGDQPVDTGFLVFNRVNYPNLCALFAELDVPVVPSNMSFGASFDGGRLEYGLASLGTVFAQKRNALRPRFWRMIRDVARFNANALRLSRENPALTVGEFLEVLGTGSWFRDYYLLPFSGAIWSTPTQRILDFPAQALVRFFDNHALLHHSGQHDWFTVEGGSVQYVRRLEASMRARGVEICTGAPVQAVRREAGSVQIKLAGAAWRAFDEVVFATHSDDSLRLLADPSPQETRALGAVRYQPKDVVLHADTSLMPKARKVWSSWVYTEDKDAPSDRIDLTYWINSLQPVPMEDPHFVTLNTRRSIREDLIYDQTVMRHPVYDLAALEAQAAIRDWNGTMNTWYCGAWMRNGFHEDGLASGLEVAEALLSDARLRMAAE